MSGLSFGRESEILTSLPFYKDLSPAEAASLAGCLRIQLFRRGDVLHAHDGDCAGIMSVVSGTVAVSTISDEGKEIALLLLRRDENCPMSYACLFQNFPFNIHFTAESDVCVAWFPAAVILSLSRENVRVECAMYKMANLLFTRMMTSMQRILFTGIGYRLSSYLLEEARNSNTTVLKVTHEQIAKYIGSAREVVSRMLKQYENAGKVRLGHGTVTLLDMPALKKDLRWKS